MFDTNYFTPLSVNYDSRSAFESNYKLRDYLEGNIKIPDNSLILDLGVGTGNFSKLFVGGRNQVVGLDKNLNMLNVALKKGITPVIADITNIPLKNNSFDYCLCRQVFQYLTYHELTSVFKEIKRVIKLSGTVYFHHMVPKDKLHSKALKKFMKVKGNDNKYLLHQDIIELAIDEGFTVIKSELSYFTTEESIEHFKQYRDIGQKEFHKRLKEISKMNINKVSIKGDTLTYRNLYSFISIRKNA